MQRACPLFVSLAEEGWTDGPVPELAAERYLKEIFATADAPDTLVLGCTHYPLLARTISDVMGPDVTLVSSADETAAAVRALVGSTSPDASRPPGRHTFLTSGDVETFRQLGERFLGPEVQTVEQWTWS